MSVIICPACRGAKQTMQMGLMYGKCPSCKGDGCIKKQEKIEVSVPTVSMDDAVSKIQTKMVEEKEVVDGRKENKKEKRNS